MRNTLAARVTDSYRLPRRPLLAGLAVGAALLGGASRHSAAAADPAPPPPPTASQVAEGIVAACRERRYSEVGEALHPTLRRTWILIGYTVREYCDLVTRDETLKDVQVVKEERVGAHAIVYLAYVYTDGSRSDDRAGFLQDRGRWKLAD